MTTLLQSAFNTFYDYDVDFKKIHSSEFIQGYKPHFNALLKKYGDVDWGTIDKEQAGAISSDVQRNVAGYALEETGKFMKDWVAKAGVAAVGVGAAASGTGVGGVAGVPTMIGGAITAGLGWTIDMMLEGIADMIEVDMGEFRKGDWCVVDETGSFRRRLPGSTANFGGQGSIAQTTKLGLYLRDHNNDREVYNVEDGTTRMYYKGYVQRIDDKHQNELNGNPILHALKGATEPAKTYDQLSKECNVRVGDKVTYRGELWEISRTGAFTNGKVTITSNGKFEEVHWETLSKALNNTTAQPVPDDDLGTFVSVARINPGEWVYTFYEDEDEYHLGVVMKCDGPGSVYVISASQDDDPGFWDSAKIEKWQRQPTKQTLGKFRMAVIEGDSYGIRDYRPDLNFSGIVKLRASQAYLQFQKKVKSSILTDAPNPSTTAIGHLASVPVADKQEAAEAFQESGPLRLRGGGYSRSGVELDDPPALDFRRQRGGWREPEVYGETVPRSPLGKSSGWREADVYGEAVDFPSGWREGPEPEKGNGNLIIGAICVAGVLIYVYK